MDIQRVSVFFPQAAHGRKAGFTWKQCFNCHATQFIFVAYLSAYHEKAINALYEFVLELPAICPSHQDGKIPLSAFRVRVRHNKLQQRN